MAELVTFDPESPEFCQPHRVYLRERWTDPWEEEPGLYAQRIVWATAPAIGEASLYRRYGRGMLHSDTMFASIARVAKPRWYVKIEIDRLEEGEPLVWVGTIEITHDLLDGTELFPGEGEGETEALPTGRQIFQALGIEYLLQLQYLTVSAHRSAASSTISFIDRALTFNRDGQPNRSPGEGADEHVFWNQLDDAVHWRTVDIVSYLLAYHPPARWDDSFAIEWEIEEGSYDVLPDWDQPVLPAHDCTVWQLLTALVCRQRAYSFYLRLYTPEDPEELEKIQLVAFTFTPEDIPVDDEDPPTVIPANPRQYDVDVSQDASAHGTTIKESWVDRYDRVIARGARRRSVFTASFADGSLEKGWTTAAELAYDAGAVGWEGFDVDENRALAEQMNAEARGLRAVMDVYSRFVLGGDDWDLTVRSAFDPEVSVENQWPIAPVDDDPATEEDESEDGLAVYPLYRPELFVLPTIPFLGGYTYGGTEPALVEGAVPPHDERPPLVAFRIPGTTRWAAGETLSLGADPENNDDDIAAGRTHTFSVHATVPDRDRSVRLQVDGGPGRHVIVGTSWIGNEADVSPPAYSYATGMLVTLAVEDDRFCQAAWPAAAPELGEGESEPDVVRTLWIDCGDGYRRDWAVPYTVWSIDPETGNRLRVQADGLVLRNDTPELAKIARTAFAWYGQARRSVEFATNSIGFADSSEEGATNPIWLGDLVIHLANPFREEEALEVNTPITQIVVEIGFATGARPPANRIQYTTGFAEFDAVRLGGFRRVATRRGGIRTAGFARGRS